MVTTSIIILTFNSSRFIENLIESLKDFSKDSEILIVDNASTDDTVKIAKKFETEVKIIETGKNLGFSKGINFGAKKAAGEFLLFINPDTVFKEGKMEDMVSVFRENEKAAVLGGKLIDGNGEPEKTAGKFFNLLETILIVLGLDEKLGVRFCPKRLKKVDFVSGGFMMVRSSIFKKLKGFDENFFMYVEDMEFCYRIKELGLRTYFTPYVCLIHQGQASSSRGFAVVNIYKGIFYFYKKHKSKTHQEIVKFLLKLKAECIYFLGRITNNSYYINTYKEAQSGLK